MLHTQHLITLPSMLLIGGVLLFLLPSWLAWSTTLTAVTIWFLYSWQIPAAKLRVIGQFLIEFVCFCTLVLLFVTTFVMMNGLIFG